VIEMIRERDEREKDETESDERKRGERGRDERETVDSHTRMKDKHTKRINTPTHSTRHKHKQKKGYIQTQAYL
jgi:hypothetical protein